MSIFLQVLLTGIAMGFIYALVGIEYTIIWNATGLLNFSHDKFIMLSAFVFAGTYVLGLGLPEPLAILFALITMFLFGAFVALVIFNPLSKYSTNLFATIGTVILGRIITEAVRLIWGRYALRPEQLPEGHLQARRGGHRQIPGGHHYRLFHCNTCADGVFEEHEDGKIHARGRQQQVCRIADGHQRAA